MKSMVRDIEDLNKVWDTLDPCFDRLEKYITEALEPITKFRKYRIFKHVAIQEFYLLLRYAMMGTKVLNLQRKLISEQSLPGIMGPMPTTDWKQ